MRNEEVNNNDNETEGQGNNSEDCQNPQLEQIEKLGSVTSTHGKHVIHCLTVVGQIEGHYILPSQNKTTKYEHVIPQLVAIEEDKEIEGLLIILNTVGGDVEAGLAIAELIAGMKKPTVSLVLGGGHSIGVPQMLNYFDKMQDRIIRFITDNSKISGDRFKRLMLNVGELVTDMGTVLEGEAAVKEGLIDNLGGLRDAIDCLYSLIEGGSENASAHNS